MTEKTLLQGSKRNSGEGEPPVLKGYRLDQQGTGKGQGSRCPRSGEKTVRPGRGSLLLRELWLPGHVNQRERKHIQIEAEANAPMSDDRTESGGMDMPLYFVRDDITRLKTDAVVLPANPLLEPGPGTSKVNGISSQRRQESRGAQNETFHSSSVK